MSKINLPNRPIAFADETAASILIRTAQENGHTNIYQLLSGTGIEINESSFTSCLIDPKRYKIIIKAIGLGEDAETLIIGKISDSKYAHRRYQFLDIPKNCFRPDASAFCSACLQEQAYWRQQWLIRPFSVCIRHQKFLVDHCLVCGNTLKVGRGNLTQCNRCDSSLLSMAGADANVASMIEVRKMFESYQIDSLNSLFEFWTALVRYDKLGEDPATENIRLHTTLSFLNEDTFALEHIAHEVVKNLSSANPRVQLLPFLSGSTKMINFAEGIISQVWPILEAADGDPRVSLLSKKEVATLLKMSPAKVNQLITSGHLKWPKDGSRQQKISTTEIEMHLQGFSQIELWCMNIKNFGAEIHRYDRRKHMPKNKK